VSDFTGLTDLAAEQLGGAVVAANDEFFAEKENLVKAAPAVWKEGLYTDRGKWMDGWETRRRRTPGHDWAIVRLGVAGIIRGIVVDTAFFRGNYPERCALDACLVEGTPDAAALESAPWREVLAEAALAGDTKNTFAIAGAPKANYVRLRIYPDGGVARLRVHGDVAPDWPRLLAHGGLVDLAALEHGGRVVAQSDAFFGHAGNMLQPGRSTHMGDGWETKRRRGPGHDWAVVKLGLPGRVVRAEIDTDHFKGNAPGQCSLDGCRTDDNALERAEWRPLLGLTPLVPHGRHLFERLGDIGDVTHVRLNIYPDGGIARLRLFGTGTAPAR
jgi:allantoicase